MKQWLKVTLTIAGNLVVVAFAALAMITRDQAYKLANHPPETRRPMVHTPADYDLAYEDVTVTTADGLKLVGWYLPSQNGAAVICMHGFRGDRTDLLPTAEILHRHGYGVLIGSFRAHDQSEGELITIGKNDTLDFEAWYHDLLTRKDVDPAKIGLLGQSLGGAVAIHYATQNPNIHALVLDSVMAEFDQSLAIGVRKYTGLPSFPTVPMLLFWARREIGVDTTQIQPTVWIREISPRPVLILQGGADSYISADSGERLYQAAGEPKEYWYASGAAHHGFDESPFCVEFERRLIGFLDRYLLNEGEKLWDSS
jgi:fermentation-respiration switch protein FrsA (DUF1100 family)